LPARGSFPLEEEDLMPELRQNIITREWVIIAKERAKRPHELIAPARSNPKVPSHDPECPFCPGNEGKTTTERYRIEKGNDWQVRVVANKFPALQEEGEKVRHIDGIFRSMTAVGYHEVVIEHPRHDLSPAGYTVDETAAIIEAHRQRYMTLAQDPRIEAVIIFKNHGEGAGTSLQHPHSQIAATPIVPTQVRHRLEESIRYFDETGECVFCRTLNREMQDGTRIVAQNKNFVAFIPYAALSPFHLWIFPVRHESSFDEITPQAVKSFAEILQGVLSKIHRGLNNPDFNFSIRSIPAREGHREYFHWYLTIIPRIGRTAGFEIGSGMYINPAIPEESARFLRDI
jgi:UDPglucose--hexose-1-phosphate uridylyltransferase